MPTHSLTRARAPRGLALFATLLTLVACQDSDYRIDMLDTGLSVDSAMRVLSDGTPIDSSMMPPPGALVPQSDTLKNVFKREEFLMTGDKIEVLYYSPNNEKWKANDTIPKGKVFPVVFVNGKLFGSGRDAYDDAVAKWNLPAYKY